MKKSNKQLRIIAATSMSIFSLAVVFVASFAWFTVARSVDTDGTGFIASVMNGIIESVEFHSMTETEYTYNETASLAFDIDNSANGGIKYTTGDSSTSVEIGTYSTYGTKKSLMVLFKLRQDSNESDYNFSLKANTSITDFTTSLLGSNGTIDAEDNSISNVVQFYTTSFSTETDVSYDFSSSKDDIQSNSSKFVTISNNTASLSSTSLSLFENTSKIHSIAVIISYNSDAMEMLYTKYLGSPVLSTGNNIYFKDIDFTLVA